jgi:hypothetical protein
MNKLYIYAVALFLAYTPHARALPLISEVLYDATGPDDGAVFVELYGAGGGVLDGWTLEGVNGSGGGIGPVLELAGAIADDGFFVVADQSEGATTVLNADLLLDFDFQNGPDSILLRNPAGEVVDALGYGSFGVADVFAGEGRPADDPAAGQSLARRFSNRDSDDNAADFLVLEAPTPGLGALAVPEPASVFLLLLVCASWIWRRSLSAS